MSEPILDLIRDESERLGLAMVGVAAPTASEHMDFYRAWLDAGHAGEMAYLGRDDAVARRADLRGTMETIRSVVVVADEYLTGPADESYEPAEAVIARYARGHDYHDVLKRKLDALLAVLSESTEGAVQGRSYVDTGPILERELAERAGLGWFGKNTMLIHPKRGSYYFLGLLLLDVDLPAATVRVEDRCGSCTACLDACPTGALLGRDGSGAPVMDARRCISYLTIEHRGSIPHDLRPLVGNRVFGCDICQEVCPWNQRFASPGSEEAYRAREGLDRPTLVALAEELLALDDSGFKQRFKGSPLSRPKRRGLLRNLCVGMGNSGGLEAVRVLGLALEDDEALVRGHAAWALGRIGGDEARAVLRAGRAVETERSVLDEIDSASSETIEES